MHIEERLKLGAIRESRSPLRSAAFIVRNHAEIAREKSRMVINYKRLNDNTVDDGYNIPYITEVRKTISSNTGKSNLELQGADNWRNTNEILG